MSSDTKWIIGMIVAASTGNLIAGSNPARAQEFVPRVVIDDVSVMEGSAPARSRVGVDVTLTLASSRTVAVVYATADGSAMASDPPRIGDYLAGSGTLSFPPGTTSQTVWIDIVVDDHVESNETFSIDLKDAVNAVLRDRQAVVTIVDDDGIGSPSAPELAIGDVSIREGDTRDVARRAEFDVRLSAPSSQPVWVDYVTADGTATALANTTAMAIPATGDHGLSSVYPSTIAVPALGGTLTDVNVTLTGLTHGVTEDVDVLLEGPDGTTVVLMSDYHSFFCGRFQEADLTFDDSWPPMGRRGCRSGTYAPTSDSSPDAFGFPAPGGTPGTALSRFNGTDPTGNWNLYIVDDDDSFFANDIGSLGGWSLTLWMSGLNDYAPTSGTLTFRAGTTRQTISVEVSGDDVIESAETFQVELDDSVNASIGDAQGVGTIIDDDGGDPRAPRIAIDDASVIEGAGRAEFHVTLSSPSSRPVSVDYATASGTATGEGNVFADANTRPMAIPTTGSHGLSSVYPSTIAVPALGGTLTDVNVTLTGLTHGVTEDVDVLLEGPDGTTVVLMSDYRSFYCGRFQDADLTFDDSWPLMGRRGCRSGTYAPTSDSSPDAFGFPAPGGTPGTALSWFNGTDPTGNWNLYIVDDDDSFYANDSGSLSGGWSLTLTTAGDGDYRATSGTLTFSAGATERTVAVDINPDVAVEFTETFRLNLSDASSNALIGDAWGIGRIFDDDRLDAGPNGAPRAAGKLADHTLHVGNGAAVGVAAAFTDPDDDLLTYRAASSASGVASVSMSDAVVTVTAVAEGTAAITITATDVGGSNATATRTFMVTVLPCEYTVTPEHQDVASTGGTFQVAVATTAACAWTARSDAVFVTVTAGATGTGPGTVAYVVAPNPDTARSGALLVAGERVTVSQLGSRSTSAFTDHPLRPAVTPIRAIHFQELRQRIDALRDRAGLRDFGWTDRKLTAGVTPVRLVHLAELRTALAAAYVAAKRPRPRFTDVAPRTIRAAHVMELRTAVLALE